MKKADNRLAAKFAAIENSIDSSCRGQTHRQTDGRTDLCDNKG